MTHNKPNYFLQQCQQFYDYEGHTHVVSSEIIKVVNDCFRYKCNNPQKKVVNLFQENAPLHNVLDVECLYNGEYSYDILEYGCTGKWINCNLFPFQNAAFIYYCRMFEESQPS